MRFVDVLSGEDVPDLADAVDVPAGVAHERQVIRPLRLEREVVPVGRTFVVPRLTDERARDHPSDRVRAREDLARDPTSAVELLESDRFFVRGHLEHGVCRRVHDPLAGPLMLLAEFLDDLCPRRGFVPEHTTT